MWARNRRAQSPKGSAPACRAIRRSIAPHVSHRVSLFARELRQGGLLRGERRQQVGLARLDARDQSCSFARRSLQGRLRRRHPRRFGLRFGAESRVRLLDAVEHDRAIHQIGEGVGSEQVRGGRARPEHHERLTCTIVQPFLHGLHLHLRAGQFVLGLHEPTLETIEGATGGGHVRRQREDPPLELRRRGTCVHDLGAELVRAPARRLDRRRGSGDGAGGSEHRQRQQRSRDAPARSVPPVVCLLPHVPPSAGHGRRLTSRAAR